MRVPTRLLALAAGFALAAGVAQAQETQAAPGKPASTLADRKVVRDPATGQLRAPTPEEDAQLRAAAAPLPPNVLQVRRPAPSMERRADGSAVGRRTLAQMQHLVIDTSGGKTTIRHGDDAARMPAPSLPTQ